VPDDPPLDEKIVLIDERLQRSDIRHAFGGALALAYYAEPRATIDVDVNVFVAPDRCAGVFDALGELGVDASGDARRRARADGQARVIWGLTPVDLFFAYDRFHYAAARRVRAVPFGDATIPILAPEDLVVCKAVFDRRRDWLDIEQILVATAGEFDADDVRAWLARIVADDDARRRKLDELFAAILGR
jgi:hypothetical protein